MKHKLLHPSRWGVALLLAVCTVACDTESGLPDTPPPGGDVPVGFSVGVGAPAATRASGELTTANLTSMGVFAYYTGQSNWNAATHTPNFMYNQRVTRSGSSAPWTYTPVKYWPNTAGDKLSFVAYAPHTSDTPGLGLGTAATAAGNPLLEYELQEAAEDQTDLLAAPALKNNTKSASSRAFAMKHMMTRILVQVKCEEAIRVTHINIGNVANFADLTWDGSGNPVWEKIYLESPMGCFHSAATDVPANTDTRVAEFFMFPATTESFIDVTFNLNGTTEYKGVNIPASPAWETGKTIAYTLNIEVGSEVTLTVKAWDTNNDNNGTMGEEVTVPSTGYPFMKNGIIYESATKSYYVGAIRSDFGGGNGGGYYNWHETIDLCRSKYSTYPYSSSEWRLPSGSELKNIGKFSLGGNEFIWAFEQASATEGTLYRLYASGGSNDGVNYGKGDYRSRVLCVRDLGDLTYPTVRQISDDLLIVHESASKSFYVGPEISDGRYSGGNGGGYYNWNECHRICNEEYSAGPFAAGQWRLPTVSEIDAMRPYGIRVNTWIYASEQANATQAWLTKIEKEVWKTAYGKTDYRSRILCVRDY